MFNLQENPEISNSKDSSCSLDLQYEICSQFMRHTSDELLRREVELIQQTSKFIERINDNLMLKDVSTTQESFTLDTLPDEEDCFSQPSRSRLLLRKSQSNVTLRRSESGFTDALSEVRRKCS